MVPVEGRVLDARRKSGGPRIRTRFEVTRGRMPLFVVRSPDKDAFLGWSVLMSPPFMLSGQCWGIGAALDIILALR